MKFEIINSLSIPKIGFGTWKIGGEAYAEPRYDGESLLALRTALDEMTKGWGLKVCKVEIRLIDPPDDIPVIVKLLSCLSHIFSWVG